MEWTIFLVASIVIAFATVFAAITVTKSVNRLGSFITPLNTVFAGVFVSLYLLFLPIRIEEFAGQAFDWLKTALITFYSVLQAFSLDGSFTDVSEAVLASAGEISYVYLAFFAILFFVAPMITFGYIISIFKNIFESVRYFFGYCRAL